MLEDYPKHVVLSDETVVTFRPMVREDEKGLVCFFQRIPEEERWYLRDNVADPRVIHRWAESLDHDRVIPILALIEDTIIADASLHRKRFGAARHIGEIRVIVDPLFRRRGLATWLVFDLIQLAISQGLQKLVAGVIARKEVAALRSLKRLDFFPEAVLSEYAWDKEGNCYDLVILAKSLQQHWVPLKNGASVRCRRAF
ncbi:MAG: GNAT family N-acetyltransferase [Candidatus Tectomicrobia bacterium]|uniref:GNAT family N-acetyltransferase n=1 Tax=Tectimicrobiota bacterium TaxID=2528274 RepID=A0A932CPJ4_UNCTE|nr:GNAT family N-acetyltransferase [Candidatus Tectomicrobia bacterium]